MRDKGGKRERDKGGKRERGKGRKGVQDKGVREWEIKEEGARLRLKREGESGGKRTRTKMRWGKRGTLSVRLSLFVFVAPSDRNGGGKEALRVVSKSGQNRTGESR